MSSAEASSKIKVVLPRQRQVHQRRKKTTKKSSLQDEVDRYCQGAAEEAFNVVLASFPDKIKALEEVRSELSIDTLWPGETDTDWVGESLRAWTKDKDKVSDENCVQDSSMRPGLFECYQGRGNNNTKAGVMVKLHDTPRMMIETNDTVHRLIQRLKPFLVELLEQLDQLVFGIQMLVPHIQEGNNFGVEVQQKALGLLENIYEETSCKYLEVIWPGAYLLRQFRVDHIRNETAINMHQTD